MVELVQVEGRVDGTIQDQGANAIGEELRVVGADQGSVGQPEIGQLLVAEGSAQAVQIAGDVLGPDVWQELAIATLASLDERPLAVEELAPFGGRVRRAVDREEVVEVVDTADLRALVDSPRVEADDVEPVADVLRE